MNVNDNRALSYVMVLGELVTGDVFLFEGDNDTPCMVTDVTAPVVDPTYRCGSTTTRSKVGVVSLRTGRHSFVVVDAPVVLVKATVNLEEV